VNPAVAAAVFRVIFPGELPDKTMFASLVMAARGRPFAVWAGATAAFTVHVVIATTVGVLLTDILPHRAVEVAVALTFFAGACSGSSTRTLPGSSPRSCSPSWGVTPVGPR
jgi:putative Ca2+/H+ antiporter (TMEM165/GDT1 family)